MRNLAVAPALHALRNLQALGYGYSHFHGHSMTALGPAIAALTALTRLEMADNLMGAEGGAVVASAVMQLTRLNLARNRCGAQGAAALPPAIARLTGLRQLTLSHNRLGLAAAFLLILVIRPLECIESLGLGQRLWKEAGLPAGIDVGSDDSEEEIL